MVTIPEAFPVWASLYWNRGGVLHTAQGFLTDVEHNLHESEPVYEYNHQVRRRWETYRFTINGQVHETGPDAELHWENA